VTLLKQAKDARVGTEAYKQLEDILSAMVIKKIDTKVWTKCIYGRYEDGSKDLEWDFRHVL